MDTEHIQSEGMTLIWYHVGTGMVGRRASSCAVFLYAWYSLNILQRSWANPNSIQVNYGSEGLLKQEWKIKFSNNRLCYPWLKYRSNHAKVKCCCCFKSTSAIHNVKCELLNSRLFVEVYYQTTRQLPVSWTSGLNSRLSLFNPAKKLETASHN